MKKLDITKPITTRDGRPVTNVCVDRGGTLWGMDDGNMQRRAIDGRVCLNFDNTADWINPPETHEITVYVYKSPSGDLFWLSYLHYASLGDATLFAKFTRPVTEGEGL